MLPIALFPLKWQMKGSSTNKKNKVLGSRNDTGTIQILENIQKPGFTSLIFGCRSWFETQNLSMVFE